jgi:hypothetical protein
LAVVIQPLGVAEPVEPVELVLNSMVVLVEQELFLV